MQKYLIIPSALIQQWEQEAIDQKIPYTEFGNFLKMKERNYLDSQRDKEERKEIFANSARNKLTEYGNNFVLEQFMKIPSVQRVCITARFDMEMLMKRLSNGFACDELKENFLSEREHWFMHLKERMKDLRISKETMESFGLSWQVAKSFAYQTI